MEGDAVPRFLAAADCQITLPSRSDLAVEVASCWLTGVGTSLRERSLVPAVSWRDRFEAPYGTADL